MKHRKTIPAAIFAAIIFVTGGGLAAKQKQQKPADDPTQDQNKSSMDHDMPGMKMGGDDQAENGAVSAMSHMHHHQMGPHMYMTALRPSNAGDWKKGDAILQELREAIEKYKDYHVAMSDGFRIFMPNLPQA